MNSIELDRFFNKSKLFLIVGPCVIEDSVQGEDFTYQIALEVKKIADDLDLPLIFKASFDKANRTSHESFRGPGLEEGLRILGAIYERIKIPILTDIHSVDQVEKASKVAHILQIPAFLCRQTDIIQETARCAQAINVKKGQFLAPWDMEMVIDKIRVKGQENIMLTERGTSFGYNNLVSDMRSIPFLRKFGYPVVYDATHSVQLPGAQGKVTGGMPEMIPTLSRAAVAAGCDGIFMEVHPNPSTALSDGSNAMELNKIKGLLESLLEIHQVIRKNEVLL